MGDDVIFGSYEQDNNTSNGKEDIEWRVLAKEDNKILLISKYALDCKQYNTKYVDVTWETCSLRAWLNREFLNTAFSNSEQNNIITINVTADKEPYYNTSPGNNTNDKVFLLSINEANKYFYSNVEWECNLTQYAIKNGVYNRCWWIRSHSDNQHNVAYINRHGSVRDQGYSANYSHYAVRPAIWVDLNK